MAISIWVRKEMAERGERIAESGRITWRIPFEVLNQNDTPLLIGVDPYGATVFNCLQIERQLPTEVEYLRRHLSDPEDTAMLDELERLMAVASQKVHRFLWFIGD